MPGLVLSEEAVERSTYVVLFSFKDEAGVAVAPTGLTYTLTRQGGAVVNNRDAVTVAPGSTVAIVLRGDDLALFGGMDTGKRFLLVEGVYDSDLGTGLPIKEEAQFSIRNLVGAE